MHVSDDETLARQIETDIAAVPGRRPWQTPKVITTQMQTTSYTVASFAETPLNLSQHS